jgi:Bacterial conjugation TrbI-like protein/Protein of unknown function (DUF2274)
MRDTWLSNRLIMPNGRSIVLERQPGADAEGYAGLEDEVDNHWGMLFKAAIGNALGRETGQGVVDPAKLIGPMLVRFMATDRVFAKLRRAESTTSRAHSDKSGSEKLT